MNPLIEAALTGKYKVKQLAEMFDQSPKAIRYLLQIEGIKLEEIRRQAIYKAITAGKNSKTIASEFSISIEHAKSYCVRMANGYNHLVRLTKMENIVRYVYGKLTHQIVGNRLTTADQTKIDQILRGLKYDNNAI